MDTSRRTQLAKLGVLPLLSIFLTPQVPVFEVECDVICHLRDYQHHHLPTIICPALGKCPIRSVGTVALARKGHGRFAGLIKPSYSAFADRDKHL